MAEKMQSPPPTGAATHLSTEIDTMINRLGQYPQKLDKELKELR
jgi:hypothetical protein